MPQERSRTLSPEKRVRTFQEVYLGLKKGEAVENARIFLERERSVKGAGCPLGTDHFAMLRLLAKGDLAGALAKLSETNPFPGITGRLAPEPFDGVQAYNRKGERISLRAIERFLADTVRVARPELRARRFPQKVAVVGSGPTGLSAAFFLSRAGYSVTIFESSHVLGGSLGYAHGEFSLPQKAVKSVIDHGRAGGIEFSLNALVGRAVSVLQLIDEHRFAAVLLATGLGPVKPLGIPGEAAAGVIPVDEAMKSLRWMKAGTAPYTTPPFLGQKVVIAGGSEIAIAMARTALRLGKTAQVVVRGTESEIRASSQVIREAAEEGVKFKTLANPVRVVADPAGCVQALVCRDMDYRVDPQGRLNLVEQGETEFTLEADTIINAQPQEPGTLFLKDTAGLGLNADGAIRVREGGAITSLNKVFAAGHAVDPGLSLLGLVLAGKNAARDIEKVFHP